MRETLNATLAMLEQHYGIALNMEKHRSQVTSYIRSLESSKKDGQTKELGALVLGLPGGKSLTIQWSIPIVELTAESRLPLLGRKPKADLSSTEASPDGRDE